jgi:hypothetical protein
MVVAPAAMEEVPLHGRVDRAAGQRADPLLLVICNSDAFAKGV